MGPQLRSLVWKEWHERKWPLALGATWIVIGVIYAVGYESFHRVHAPLASFYTTCTLFGIFWAVFLAMRTSLGEVTQGTLGFSSSLPVSLRQQAWVRLGGAVVALVGPVALGALALCVVLLVGIVEQASQSDPESLNYMRLPYRPVLSGFEASKLVWTVAAIATASSVQLLLILSVIGARRRAQAHLGFIGAFVASVWFLLQGLSLISGDTRFVNWCAAIVPQSLVLVLSYQDAGASFGDLWFAQFVWLPLAANLLVLAALGWWFARRYGSRPLAAPKNGPHWLSLRLPSILPHFPIRWPGRIAALLWLDLRQALPMCVAGLALACLLAAVNAVGDQGFDSLLPQRIAGQLPGGTWIVAILWGAVVGSGVFASEFEPRLEQFWRSRPISASTWFWVKFFAGLAAVLGVLDVVTILVSWGSPYAQDPNRMSIAYIACMPLLHALFYTLAMLGTCWLRRPVLAAMAAVVLFFVVSMAFEFVPGGAAFEPIKVYNALFFDECRRPDGTLNLLQHGYPVVYGSIASVIVIASLAAWQAALRPS
jgi:ABC-type transport system involved in multi-copper enzyme maturation permease subunit